jgi:iron complex outermembrane receptor protein
MKIKQKPVAAAVSLALASALPAYAQQAGTPEAKETVTVTGIRASIEKSLDTKKNADTVTEVITAEDIGKLPDKNIADAVQRLPGVTTSSSAGGEGGFDENDRVSLRGTNPSLTQTTINGHMVSSGDWFVLDQVGLVGRSVSFTMLPSELVSQVIIRKSQTADMVEGGVAGDVDIITRKPLQFAKPVTVSGSVGTVYADLPGKWDPQASVLINWKNDTNNFGVMLQGFYEERHLRRDGQEILGYATIDPASSLAHARPDLAGVAYPTLIGSAFFEQERKRKGGLISFDFKPINELSLNFEAFTSRLDATNYNRNWMMWGSKIVGTDNRVPTSYTVTNGTLTQAVWPNAGVPGTNAQYAIVDQIYRPGAYSQSDYQNLDATWHFNDRLTFFGQLGITRGKGVTPEQDVFEGDVFNTGATYNMHGIGGPTDVAFPNGNPSVFTGTSLDWIFGASPASTEDKERYARVDGEYTFADGYMRSLKGGLRYAEHTRETHQVSQGPNFALDPFNPANLPAWSGQTYPSDFGSGLGGTWPKQPWMLDPGVLQAWGNKYSNRDPLSRQYWPGEFALKEKDPAGYVMANFEGTGWSGNAGVRFVQTKEDVTVNVGVDGSVCPPQTPCPQVPGAITTSAFGTFYKNVVSNTYNDVLPSANLRWDLGRNMIGRLAAARTMARPDFSALGGSITADDTTHTGNGGNPNLKPITSNNFDAVWEWYFAPRALVSANLFYMDLDNYVGFGVHQQTLLNIRTGTFDTYNISSPINSKGTVKGFELAWYQPLAYGFGFETNYTYADSKENKNCASGDLSCQNSTDRLVGASKNTYNLTGYYENYGFSARLSYSFRSSFFVGLDRSTPEFQDDTGTLAASLGYQINKQFAVYFDALNINNPTLKYYAANTDQPRAFYKNGRQYYISLRVAL